MATTSRRVVISGVGVVCPIGLTLDTFWQSLQEGRSGVRRLSQFDPSGLPVQFGGQIVGFDAKQYIPKENKEGRKSLKVMARTIQLAVSAAQLAMDDCQIDKNQLDPARFGVEFGAGLIATELEELGDAAKVSVNCQPMQVNLEAWGEQGLAVMPPLWMLKYLPNMLACHVSIMHNAQGPSNTVTESDVAGLLALGEAYRIIGRDGADFFLVGGADSRLNPLSLVRQCLFLPLSRRNDSPERACRPFDRGRDGVVIGEGGSVLALEDLEHAKKRGAPIYAEVAGFGAAFDRQRSGSGLARAVRAALKEAGISPEDIDHINANGYSTTRTDVWEARGLHEVFGTCATPTPVFALKSYIGNLGAGSGTTELSASLLALKHGTLPASLNYDEPDPECPVAVHTRGLRPVQKPYFLKVGFTDLGQCAAVVCRKI
jgi:3-oxoacyl-[acyl-carrier-protein] synthase II